MDNTLRDLQNSSYPTKVEFNNCFNIHLKSFPAFKGVSPFRSLFSVEFRTWLESDEQSLKHSHPARTYRVRGLNLSLFSKDSMLFAIDILQIYTRRTAEAELWVLDLNFM